MIGPKPERAQHYPPVSFECMYACIFVGMYALLIVFVIWTHVFDMTKIYLVIEKIRMCIIIFLNVICVEISFSKRLELDSLN